MKFFLVLTLSVLAINLNAQYDTTYFISKLDYIKKDRNSIFYITQRIETNELLVFNSYVFYKGEYTLRYSDTLENNEWLLINNSNETPTDSINIIREDSTLDLHNKFFKTKIFDVEFDMSNYISSECSSIRYYFNEENKILLKKEFSNNSNFKGEFYRDLCGCWTIYPFPIPKKSIKIESSN